MSGIWNQVSAQYNNNWYFGYPTGSRVNFNTTPPTVTSALSTSAEGSSSISDADGNPLFYTNGVNIWDATVTPNTSFSAALKGDGSGTQTAVIMPRPGYTDQWLVFTGNVDVDGTNKMGLNYHVVSGASATSGPFTLGPINNLAGTDEIGEGLCIIGSTKPGVSFWVIVREVSLPGGSANIRAYPVSTTGTVGAPVISSAGGMTTTAKQGFIKANSCQNKLAFSYMVTGKVEVYDFDTFDGDLVAGSLTTLNVPSAYGLEWSPADNYLYATELAGQIHQFTVGANGTAWADYTYPAGASGYAALQLGPDGKIYAARPSTTWLGVLTVPNNAGAPGNLTANGLAIANGVFRGLPSFPRSLTVSNPYITPRDQSICGTPATVNFSYIFGGLATGTTWDFGDGTSSSSLTPSKTYNSTGTYRVILSVTDNCSRTGRDTVYITVEAKKTPAGSITCSGSSMTMTATGATAADYPNYIWYTSGPTGGSIIGTGTPVTLNYGDPSNAPSSVWVEVGGSTSVAGSGTNVTLGPTTANMSYLYSPPVLSNTIDVLTDVLTLKSFVIKPSSWPSASVTSNLSFTVQIITSGGSTVFSKNYSYTGLSITDPGTPITVDLNAVLPQGNNYEVVISSLTSSASLNWRVYSGAFPFTNAGVARNDGSAAYPIMGNFIYDYTDYTVTTACSDRIQVIRSCPLPVELLGFYGVQESFSNVLFWSTAWEQDNDYFVLERSADGKTFEPIASIEGKGTFSGVSNYSNTDEEPLPGINYYRLAQYDFNGSSHFSKIISLSRVKAELKADPNPSAESFLVQLPLSKSGGILSVRDVLGREVERIVVAGETNSVIVGEMLAPGNYYLNYTSETANQVIKVVKH